MIIRNIGTKYIGLGLSKLIKLTSLTFLIILNMLIKYIVNINYHFDIIMILLKYSNS